MKVFLPSPAEIGPSTFTALINPTRGAGTIIEAEYLNLTEGESWQGIRLLAWMAWHWENMNGCFFPEVWLVDSLRVGGKGKRKKGGKRKEPWIHPSQSRAVLSCGELDGDLDFLVLGGVWQGDVEGTAKFGMALVKVELRKRKQ